MILYLLVISLEIKFAKFILPNVKLPLSFITIAAIK